MKLRLGTRGSELALTQSRWVATELEKAHLGLEVELIVISTSGDRDQNSALNKFGGKGIFTKEIEEALLEGAIDLAVHSLKDLPTTLPQGLMLADPPKREDPRDLLVSKVRLQDLPPGAIIGTGSARRREQLRLLRPDFQFAEIRGNVTTRVRKWREGPYQATVLACAGVNRLGSELAGLGQGDSQPLDTEECLPAPGQGILGLEIRQDDSKIEQLIQSIACPETKLACLAERSFLHQLDGGCHLPAAAWAEVGQSTITLTGFLAQDNGDGVLTPRRLKLSAPLNGAVELGRDLAKALRT